MVASYCHAEITQIGQNHFNIVITPRDSNRPCIVKPSPSKALVMILQAWRHLPFNHQSSIIIFSLNCTLGLSLTCQFLL